MKEVLSMLNFCCEYFLSFCLLCKPSACKKVHLKNEEVMKYHLKEEEIKDSAKETQHKMSTHGFLAILITTPCLELRLKTSSKDCFPQSCVYLFIIPRFKKFS